MSSTPSIARLTEALSRAQQNWQARRHEPGTGTALSILSIAITREAGAPGTEVAHELGRRLDWPVYDHELLEQIAREMGLRVSLVESLDERRQSWMRECLEALSSAPVASEESYVHHLAETILSLGAHGHCIIVGRGAAQILPAETTLRIRLIGSHHDRVEHFMRRFGVSRAEAERRVAEVERERTRFIKEHFLRDPTEPEQYDLLINFSRWSIAESAELIMSALEQLERKRG